jgi:hypothetical protein
MSIKNNFIGNTRFCSWNADEYAKQVILQNKDRALYIYYSLAFEKILSGKEFTPEEIYDKNSNLTKRFREINLKEIKNTTNTEILEGLMLLNFFSFESKTKIISFPVNNSCPSNINVNELEKYKEDNSPYDILIENDKEKFYMQLKDFKENEFNPNSFNGANIVKRVEKDLDRYHDKNMVIVYFLQLKVPKERMCEVLDVFSQLRGKLIEKKDIEIKAVYFFGSESKTVITLTEFFPKYQVFRLTDDKIV